MRLIHRPISRPGTTTSRTSSEARYTAYEQMAEKGRIFGRKVPAIDLWKQMLKLLFETGHPWITFKDACNIRSPQDHVGVIHSSNPCTEITLNTSAEEVALCNLGSVVLDTRNSNVIAIAPTATISNIMGTTPCIEPDCSLDAMMNGGECEACQ